MSLMSELNAQIRENTKEFGRDISQTMHHTGLRVLDYLNGQQDTNGDGKPILGVGIDAGKSILLVGNAGSGKSTLALQIASGVMAHYTDSTLYVMDFEQSWTDARIKSVTGWSEEYFNDHVTIKKVGIYTDTVLKLILQLARFKKEHEKELLVDNVEGYLNEDGSVRKILPPTFVIVDSLAMMSTKESVTGDNENDLSSLTAGGRNAIMNKDLMKRCLQPCMEANIIMIYINHINTNMSMSVTPPVASTRYLKNTESVSGGKAVQYGVNLFIKVEAGAKLEKKDKYGIKGFEGLVTIVKSRNAEAGRSSTMIFNQREGFDDELSTFEFMKDNHAVIGTSSFVLAGDDSVKFRYGNLKDALLSNSAFKAEFDKEALACLAESVKVSSKVKQAAEEKPVEEELTVDMALE